MSRATHAALWIAVACILAGCFSAPVKTPSSTPSPPTAFKEVGTNWTLAPPAEAQPRGEWWRVFGDPQLDALMLGARENNTSIQGAAGRLAAARALVRASDAARSLQVGTQTGVSRQGGPLLNAAGTSGSLFTLSASASYEVDVFGRLAGAANAAQWDAQARAALLQSTGLMVQADVALTYVALRALDAERALVRGTLATYKEGLRLTEHRLKTGMVAELDVVRARAEVTDVESELLTLDRQRAELEHAMAVEIGSPASTFQLPEQPWEQSLPVIPAGIPSRMLARRPDVSAAQQSVLAAQARLGVAQSAWFPNLALTGSGGYAAPDLSEMLRSSALAWGLGAFLSLPIFDGGRRDAELRVAEANRETLLAEYRERILVAFREVEDQLSALRFLAEQAEVARRANELADRVTQLSESRYQSGLISQIEVLDARRNALRQQRQALKIRLARFQSTIGLIKALGGGWDASDGPSNSASAIARPAAKPI